MQQAMAQGQQQFSAALRFAASPDCSQLHSVQRGTSALATLLRRGILRGKLSQGTEAKELDTNRLTKHCGWKRSIYWSANFLHSNRDAAPADRPATNTTSPAIAAEPEELSAPPRCCQPTFTTRKKPGRTDRSGNGRRTPQRRRPLVFSPSVFCGYLEGDEQGTARSHAQMVMLGNPAEIGIHVDPRAHGGTPVWQHRN